VKASVAKYIARVATGAFKDSQYRTVYFFQSGDEVDKKYRHYISSFGKAVAAFRERHNVFPILVAMERLDAQACRFHARVPSRYAGVYIRRLRYVSAGLHPSRFARTWFRRAITES